VGNNCGKMGVAVIMLLLLGAMISGNEARSTRAEDVNDAGSGFVVDPEFSGPSGNNRPLKFASFNIQIFGKRKMQQNDVVDVLVKILNRYDLVLIQEIRDSEEKWTQELLNVLNSECHEDDKYDMIISDRLGRTASKEQYGFFYRKRLLTVKSSFHYDDGEEIDHCVTEKQKQKEDKKAQRLMAAKQENETLYPQIPADLDDEVVGENETQVAAKNDRPVCIDTFQREPFVVRFYSKTTVVKDFSVIACHTDPGEAVKEIDALYDVYKKVKSRYGSTEVIIAGDLNASGQYMPKKYWDDIRLRNDQYWNWLIPDNADTTTGRSNAAYDRFIISKRGRLDRDGGIIKESVKVFDFQEFFGLDDDLTSRVSDHYPIELQMLADN